MSFHEILARERKARGMSQEDLAGRVQVSRQAVSKWETGDAMPDLNKLLALADALEISLDALCGRKAPPSTAADTGSVRRGKARLPWLAMCVLLAVCLAAGGLLWQWNRRNIVPSDSAPAASTLPDSFTVSGLTFYGRTDFLVYQFVPSIAGEQYAYQITFTDAGGVSQTFDAVWEGGVCAGTAAVSPYGGSLVTVTVSDGASARSAAVAKDLSYSEGHASWTPLEEGG